MVSYINPANQAPGLQTGQVPGGHMFILSYIAKEPSKLFLSETMRPRPNRLSMQRCLVVPNTNTANHAPGVQIGHTLGVISSQTYNGKNQKIYFSETMRPKAYVFRM